MTAARAKTHYTNASCNFECACKFLHAFRNLAVFWELLARTGRTKGESEIGSKAVFGALLVSALAMPALAQSTTLYSAQDVKTKKCTIVDKQPTDTVTTTVVGDGKVYTTRTEAETAMKTVKVCTTN